MIRLRKRHFAAVLGCALALTLILTVRGLISVRAQGVELLTNNGMDSYVGGTGGVVPTGWTLTANVPVNSSKQDWVFNEFPGFGSSWKVSTSKYAFTMNAYQFVAGVRAGTPLVFSAYANIFTCDRQDSCITAESPRTSQRESGAQVRIGIDPTGGRDPNAPTVKWSAYIQPFDQFLPMSIEARSENDNGVTVFLNATQSVGMLLNDVYWDNVSLLSGAGSGGAGGVPIPPTVPRDVPFVTPQNARPDGSIIHTVIQGDTLFSIAVAYNITVTELRRLNNIPPEEYVLQIGQQLIIKTPAPNVTFVVVTATPTPDPNVPLTSTPTPFIVLPTNTPSSGGGISVTIIPVTVVTNTPKASGENLTPAATLVAAAEVPASPTKYRLNIPPQDVRRILTVRIQPRSTFATRTSGSVAPTVETVALVKSATSTSTEIPAETSTAKPTETALILPTGTPTALQVVITTPTPTDDPTPEPITTRAPTETPTEQPTQIALEVVVNTATAQPTASPTDAAPAPPFSTAEQPSVSPTASGFEIVISTPTDSTPTDNAPALSASDLPSSTPLAAIQASATAIPTTAALPTLIPPTEVALSIPVIAMESIQPDQTRLCVLAFDDANTNRLRDQGEPLLTGMQINLLQEGMETRTLSTAAGTPACFADLAQGTYTLVAVPPETYGMTTASQLQVEVLRGVALMVGFGAAGSYQPTSLPAALELPPPSTVATSESNQGPLLAFLVENPGVVIIALAGLTLLSGLAAAVIVRRS